MEQYGPLPPGVYGGEIFVGVNGLPIVVNGVDGRVHILFGDDSRTLRPKDARRLARSLLEAADLMDAYPQEHTDKETVRLAARRPRKRDREIQ